MTLRAALIGLFFLTAPAARAQTFFDEVQPAAEARIPGFLGPTGLLETPSAYVLRGGEVAAHLGGDADFAAGGIAAGIGGRLEVGATLREGEGAAWTSAKWNLVPETLVRPALALGVVDAFDASRRSGYVVASKYLIPYLIEALTGQTGIGVKLHVGYGGGIYGHDLFAGTELILPGDLSGLAEIRAGRVHLGVRYLRRGLSATVALFGFDRIGGAVSYGLPLR